MTIEPEPEPTQAERLVAAAIDLWTTGNAGSYIEYLEPSQQEAEGEWYDENEAEILRISERLFLHLVEEVEQGKHWLWGKV